MLPSEDSSSVLDTRGRSPIATLDEARGNIFLPNKRGDEDSLKEFGLWYEDGGVAKAVVVLAEENIAELRMADMVRVLFFDMYWCCETVRN